MKKNRLWLCVSLLTLLLVIGCKPEKPEFKEVNFYEDYYITVPETYKVELRLPWCGLDYCSFSIASADNQIKIEGRYSGIDYVYDTLYTIPDTFQFSDDPTVYDGKTLIYNSSNKETGIFYYVKNTSNDAGKATFFIKKNGCYVNLMRASYAVSCKQNLLDILSTIHQKTN